MNLCLINSIRSSNFRLTNIFYFVHTLRFLTYGFVMCRKTKHVDAQEKDFNNAEVKCENSVQTDCNRVSVDPSNSGN